MLFYFSWVQNTGLKNKMPQQINYILATILKKAFS